MTDGSYFEDCLNCSKVIPFQIMEAITLLLISMGHYQVIRDISILLDWCTFQAGPHPLIPDRQDKELLTV